MLLFGFLLLSTVLAARGNLDNDWVKACIQEGIVISVEPREANETLTSDCSGASTTDRQSSFVFLNLRDRNITGFARGWYRLSNYSINGLVLSHNKIVEITNEILDDLPPGLVEVDLQGNMIECLPTEGINNKYVTWLHLANNSISEIQINALMHMEQLGVLNLSNNRLTRTEFTASLPPYLEYLYLNDNSIEEIASDSVWELPILKMLWLDRNKISVIRKLAFRGLKHLKYLNLSENPIRHVERGTLKYIPLINAVQSGYSEPKVLINEDDILSSYDNTTLILLKRAHSTINYECWFV